MPDKLAVQLDSLPSMSKQALLTLWRQLFQTALPDHLRRQLMVRILAHKAQEEAFRGLNPDARQLEN